MSRQMCQQVLGPPETVGDFCPPGAPLVTAASVSPAATVVPPSASWRAGLHKAPPVHRELPPQAGQPQKRQTTKGRGRKGGQARRPDPPSPSLLPRPFLTQSSLACRTSRLQNADPNASISGHVTPQTGTLTAFQREPAGRVLATTAPDV